MKKILPGVIAILRCIILLLFFQLHITDVHSQATANIKFSNSYVNVTKNAIGGTVEPGDILEIRTTLYIRSTYNVGGRIYFLRYIDNIPTNTTIQAGSTLNTITNEGVTLTSYTQGADADAGTYLAAPSPGEFQVKINMGGAPFGAAPTAPLDNTWSDETGASDLRGNVNQPLFGGGTLISTAFRVQVTGAIGDLITLGDGHLAYKKTNGVADADTIVNAIQYQILISANQSVCSNTIGTNFANEFGGTFGTGSTLNRPTGPDYAIPGYTYLNNVRLYPSSVSVNDGYYAIVNNTSPKSATNINSRKYPNCAIPAGPIPAADSCNGRMFGGFWEIGGDHTGTNDAVGNPPPGPGVTGGYMLMVNSDVATTEAYRQDITGLCPDTYYEFSAWVKNICTVCGILPAGGQSGTPGVLPNLTFAIDDVDRYSSGQVDVLGWLKKGFLFRTNPGQTSITVSIRNNAPGGGGNDWALDDINIATCSPNLVMTPSPLANICYGNQVDISTIVTSYFPNYDQWLYEKSTDGGVTWTPDAPSTSTPILNGGGQYEYTAAYPTFIGDSSTHNNIYRIRIASSLTNLMDPNCSFLTNTTIQILVDNCQWILKTDIAGINGQLKNNMATINWSIADEAKGVKYILEKSTDKIHFNPVTTISSKGITDAISTYSFTDPIALTGAAYYRIKLVDGEKSKLSNTVLLNTAGLNFEVKSIVNPFRDALNFEVIVPADGIAGISLVDDYGKLIKFEQQKIRKGLNSIKLSNTAGFSSGTYVLRIQFKNEIINKRVIKLTR